MKKLRLISLLAAAAVTQGLCTAVNAENLNTAQIRGKDALTALLSSAGAADPDAETAQICAILSQAGIDDVSSLINPGTRLTSVGQSDCKDLNDDGVFDAVDSMYILHFLQGKKDYQHAYSDMDANHDDIIDQTDAYCYTQYYVKMLALGYSSGNIPYSAHNTGSAPTIASESRTYVKHYCSDGIYPSSNDVYYSLGTTNTIIPAPVQNLSISAMNLLDEIDAITDVPDPSNFTKVQDTRIVRTSVGTGAIVGDNLILTNAHGVCSGGSGEYYLGNGTNYKVTAFTFDNSGNPIEHDLNVVSVHVPLDYFDSTYEYQLKYDYALLVVSDDLYDYGHFTLGVPLDTAVTNQRSAAIHEMPGCAPCTDPNPNYPNQSDRNYVVASYGYIRTPYNPLITDTDIYLTTSGTSFAGSSGSPIFCQTSYSPGAHQAPTQYDAQVAVLTGGAGGLRVIRPLLRFLYDNPYL